MMKLCHPLIKQIQTFQIPFKMYLLSGDVVALTGLL